MRGNMHNFRLGRHAGYWKAIWQEPGYGQRRQTLYDEFNASIKAAEPKEKAERAYNAFCHRLSRAARPAEPTIGEILRGYVDDRKGSVAAPERLEFSLQALKPFHAHAPSHITPLACREYTAARLQAKRSIATAATELGTLRTALLWAQKNEWIETAPTVDVPDKPPARDRWLQRSEADRLIASASSLHIRLFIIVALSTAARKKAILDLTWDQIDWENRLVDFRSKVVPMTAKRRTVVPINDTLLKALREAHGAATTDYVIEYAGGRVKDVKKGIRLTAKRAGIDGVTPHVFRHTAATWMAQKGIKMDKIAEYLGHTDSRTTRKYAHWQPDFLTDAAEALEL